MLLVRLLEVLGEPEVMQEFSTADGGVSTPKLHTLQGSTVYIYEITRAQCQGHWPAVSLREEQEMGKWEKERAHFSFHFNVYLKFFRCIHFLGCLFYNFN